MSLQAKSKNVRILSAKVTLGQTERIRPLSGVPNHTYTRRQMIETVYNSQGTEQIRVQSARHPANNFVSLNFENDRPIRKTTKQAKQKQQMASQIFGLKQTVNRLVEQLSLQKGKCENMRKKSLKYSKLLTMQFQDQKQWTSNSVNNHLVAGIKNMYDTLKEKYQAKCQEFDNFIRKVQITKDMENEQYTKALESQIKNLKKKIEKTNELNINSAFSNQTQRYANQYVIADLQNEKILLIEKNKQLEKKIKLMTQNFKEFQIKIQLDKKLITEKDNNLHAFQRKNKELTKQCQKFKQLNLILDKQLAEMKQKYEKQALEHKEFATISQIKCKNQVQLITKSKNTKIQSLEQDNAYLHKMIQDLRSTNLQLNKANQQLREQNIKNSSKGQDNRSDDRDFKKQSKQLSSKSENKSSITLNNVFDQNGKRLPQKADKKYHENAVKTRKIQLVQVLQISQLVRLKLIAQQLSIENVKKLFNYNQDSNKSQKDKSWQKEYITMAQVKQLFTKSPFCLDQSDSTIISRYLIEDVQEDYVYYDEMNQNHREVIKSIIKTLIQEYPTYSDGSPQYYQMNDAIEKYGKNLRNAIKTITKEATISKAKLSEAMKYIGMDVQQKIFQLILSKMAVKSKKLNALDYSTVI